MKAIALFVGIVFLGFNAYSEDFSFDGKFDGKFDGGIEISVNPFTDGNGHDCMKKAWDDAQPTPEQNANAGKVVQIIKRVYEHQKPEIAAGQARLHAVLVQHPIHGRKARKALRKLVRAASPVQAAMFQGTVSIINLLNSSQRDLFNKSFVACTHP